MYNFPLTHLRLSFFFISLSLIFASGGVLAHLYSILLLPFQSPPLPYFVCGCASRGCVFVTGSGGVLENCPQDDSFSCRWCAKICSSRYNLRKHERDMHVNRGKKYSCETCRREYSSLNSLQVHRSNSHPTGVVRKRHLKYGGGQMSSPPQHGGLHSHHPNVSTVKDEDSSTTSSYHRQQPLHPLPSPTHMLQQQQLSSTMAPMQPTHVILPQQQQLSHIPVCQSNPSSSPNYITSINSPYHKVVSTSTPRSTHAPVPLYPSLGSGCGTTRASHATNKNIGSYSSSSSSSPLPLSHHPLPSMQGPSSPLLRPQMSSHFPTSYLPEGVVDRAIKHQPQYPSHGAPQQQQTSHSMSDAYSSAIS